MSDAPSLSEAEFPAFFRAVHGHDPFPWQRDLTARVLADARWPDLIDVPTGLGKTSLLDIAVFVTAATAHLDGPERTGRRRVFLVVDRRIVVDEAYTHAQTLSAALQSAEDGHDRVVARVAAGLRALAPHAAGDVLPVTRMRGGTTWADAWLDRPDRPGIVLGTVDQVGSRLLFRGYGVSDRRRPIDAALVGTDSLVMVDEAHLAAALLTTVGAAQDRDTSGLPLPGLTLMRMSATAKATAASYRIDLDAHRTDTVAWQRLTAGKRLALRESTPKAAAGDIARAAVEHLEGMGGDRGRAPAALVVCNTVDRARAVHAQLRIALPGADCELLIGRTRPVDRPEMQHRVLALLGTGRSPSDRTAVLVATQTVEVGVNLDADVLVTESASWEALVQRLGRLNRLGRHAERFPGHDAAAIVVHDGQADGPIYGASRDATWAALTALAADAPGGIDVSPIACRQLSTTVFAGDGFQREPGDVPILLQPTLDTWAQTGPVPQGDPPIAPFLHGFDGGTTPVQIVWRDGLVLADDPLDDPFEDGDAERAGPQVDALLTQWPPRTPEIVEIPFLAARRWLAGQATGPVGDVDISDEEASRTASPSEPIRALVQRPARSRLTGASSSTPVEWRWIDDRNLRPGDRIVVPTVRGGLDEYGWAPTDHTPVTDVSEAAAFIESRSRREAALRLDTGLTTRLGIDDGGMVAALLARSADLDEEAPTPDEIAAAGRTLADRLPMEPPPASGWKPTTWAVLRTWLSTARLRIVEINDPTAASFDAAGRSWARLLAGPLAPGSGRVPAVEGDDDEVAASSVASGPVTLADHHAAVRHRAGEIGRALRLPAELLTAVEDAAGWHDLGKVEERFQVMLHGGDPAAAASATEPLAKSGLDSTDRMAWRRAHRLSRLPGGARHEAWSAALVEQHLAQADEPYSGDADLVLHLVASHHGHSRPLAQLVVDPAPMAVQVLINGHKRAVASEHTVSLDHPARFARLNRRYGRWGLALLEAIVRCADMTVSGEGS